MLACVALQERIWNGESMEISKCLRLVGSLSSILESRSTIYTAWLAWSETQKGKERALKGIGGESYLDPMVDLDVLVCSIKM